MSRSRFLTENVRWPVCSAVFFWISVVGAAAAPGLGANLTPVKLMVDPAKVTSVLRLRADANTSSNVLGRLSPGTILIATGPARNGFRPVTTQFGAGWVEEDFLKSADMGARVYSLNAPSGSGEKRGVDLLGTESGATSAAGGPAPRSPSGDTNRVAGRPSGSNQVSGNPLRESLSVVTSPFGPRPWMSAGVGSRVHAGTDLRTTDAAGAQKPIYALGDGQVTIAGVDRGGGGNYISVTYDDGHRTEYLHLSSFVGDGGVQTRVGMRVRSGTKLGMTGSTGWASRAPHLHFVLFGANSTAKIDALAYEPIGRTLNPNPGAVSTWRRYGWQDPRRILGIAK